VRRTRAVRRGDGVGFSKTTTRTRAVTSPSGVIGLGDESDDEVVWKRLGEAGVDQARELWSAVNNEAAAAAKGAWAGVKPTRKVPFSDILASPKRNAFLRKWIPTDITYVSFIGAMHLGCLLAPFTFTWGAFKCFLAMYFITGCLGITLSYHRQIAHKSFRTPKWLEYVLAYCGALAMQGDPLEWASSHRYHHQHCDTPKDPHTPYEGFWWSHAGWLLDNEATIERVGDRSNAAELASQPFYRFMEKTYMWHIAASAAALYALGGLPWLVWGFCVRTVWVWHITWAVNSVAHCWGSQEFNTGDLSRNNWLIGILAYGEGWHNNHHAFEFSARHGLKWWQFDMTWMVISVLKFLRLADKVKLPKESQMERMRIQPTQA
jgi:stearoyl-CoA desaturase (delta-9 desaturase)